MPSSAAVSAFALLVLAAICMAQCSASQHSDVMVDRYIRKCGYDLVRTMWKVCSRRASAVKRGAAQNLSPLGQAEQQAPPAGAAVPHQAGGRGVPLLLQLVQAVLPGAVLRLTQELNLNWRHPELASPTSPSLFLNSLYRPPQNAVNIRRPHRVLPPGHFIEAVLTCLFRVEDLIELGQYATVS
uniref:Secreted protein n=1 Tax=Macrostomum lignano TaxID=282301 RepID=A0A1I8FDW0_9PLAT